MGFFRILRDVIGAFEQNPNDRSAYRLGMQTLPKLIGLLKSYQTQERSAVKPPRLKVVR